MQAIATGFSRLAQSAPPHLWFAVSAVFHYLGPSFAVLLFPYVGVLGVAWLRIATAAIAFIPITRPWRVMAKSKGRPRWLLIAFGLCLAMMNCSFYLALDRLPLSLVAAIEFVGTIGLALVGLRSRRNLLALMLAVAGTFLLINIRWSSDSIGLLWAILNGFLFVCYVAIGHRLAREGAASGIANLGAAMTIAFIFVLPVGFTQAMTAFSSAQLLGAAIGVGICSSVIPYVCDQLAMARLPRASFALMLSLLPLSATLIGIVVLRQIPGPMDVLGIGLVAFGIAIHKPAPERS